MYRLSDPDTPAGTYIYDILDDLGLSQLVDQQPTRYSESGKRSSLLDLVITNAPIAVSHLTLLPPVSDHCPVVFDVSHNRSAGSKAQISSAQNTWLDFAHTDWQAFNDHVYQCINSFPDAPASSTLSHFADDSN